MDVHAKPWISIDIHTFPCISLHVHGYSGLPNFCTTFQTQIPFTPADDIGRAPSRKKHGARVSILCEGVQRGAAEKWCRIMAIHRLNFLVRRFGKLYLGPLAGACVMRTTPRDGAPARAPARTPARPAGRPGKATCRCW